VCKLTDESDDRVFLRRAGLGLVVLGVLLTVAGLILLILPSSYEAAVRLKAIKDIPDAGILGSPAAFDPYWLQDQFEILQSKAILFRVITNLNLTRKWSEKLKKTEPLRIEDAYVQLKKQIDVRQSRSTSLIEIRVRSEDPLEAAAIANEIASVYCDHRAEVRYEMAQRGIRILEAELEKRNREFTNKLAEIEALRASSGTNGSEAPALETLKLIRKKLGERIIQEKADLVAGHRPDDIVDKAEPPPYPQHPQKRMAVTVLFAGFGAFAIGTVLLSKF